jgi:hypothetical protein
VTLPLYGEGRVTVDRRIVEAVHALNACLERHRYPTRRNDTGAYNCRKITGGTGYSLHAYGIALDINWQSNPYGPKLITNMPSAMVNDIKAIRTKGGALVWRWGGDYKNNKDAMHYEVACSPAALATGIAGSTAPTVPKPPATEGFHLSDAQYKEIVKRLDSLQKQIDTSKATVARSENNALYVVTPSGRWPLVDSGQFPRGAMLQWLQVLGLVSPGDPIKADNDYLHGVPKLDVPGKTPSK